MNAQPLVSVIINNYNYAQFVAQAINSVLEQTYSNCEILVVDDGSTDSSRQVIESFGKKVCSIFQKNGKQAAALNTGFENSRGDIIIFLDSDDYLLPDAIEKVVTAFQEGVGKVHYRLQVVDGNNQSLGYFIPSVGMKLATGEVWHQLLKTSSYVSSPMSGNAYLRKTLIPIFPIPDAYKTTADDYLMISTPFYAQSLASLDEPIGAYRVHESNQWALSSVSGSRFRRFVQHDLQNFALLKQRSQEAGIEFTEDLEHRSLGRVWSRLASLRLEPEEHPVKSDNVLQLLSWGLQALWLFSSHNIPKKIIYSLLFLWVSFMPVPLAKQGLTWLYAPHLRPKVIDQVITKVRTLVTQSYV
ncbi:MAG: glycosyltransferase family 2 protein [Thainema sp.]